MGRGGVGDVMGDEADHAGVEARERRLQERRREPGVERAQALPSVGGDVGLPDRRPSGRGIHRGYQRGVVGVGDGVEVLGGEPGGGEAPGRGGLGDLPRRERHGLLAMLAPAEALLFGGGHGYAVNDDGGGGIVEDRVHTEDPHTRSWEPHPAARLC
jgi:hypothetical protein